MKFFSFTRCFPAVAVAAGLGALTASVHGQAFGLKIIDINNPIESIVRDNEDGSWTVEAGGGDTWDTADSFTYLYQQRDGDFDVKVKVVSLSVTDCGQQDSAKASLHVRANLSPGSADVMINATPPCGANYVETIWRRTEDAGTDDPPNNELAPLAHAGPYPGTFRTSPLYPVWLRMQRRGNVFTTMASQNGYDWDALAEFCVNPAQVGSTVYLGLATVAHIGAGENLDNRVSATYSDYGDVTLNPTIEGMPAPADRHPGYLPTASVTAMNFSMAIPADGMFRDSLDNPLGFIVINGANKNEVIGTIDSQGPIPWSVPGYNQGDLDISLSPSDPNLSRANLGPYANPNRERDQPGDDLQRSEKPQSQAWIPSTRDGVIFPSIRKNGQSWNDDGAGGPTPTFFGFGSVSVDFSSRRGYSMVSGEFENGEIYISLYKVGESEPSLPGGASPHALREANLPIGVAWFPFAQGWKAGYIHDATRAPEAFWRKVGAHGPTVCDNTTDVFNTANAIVQWQEVPSGGYGGLATLTLPGVNTADGMLFVVSNDDESDNEAQVASATPLLDDTGVSWTIALRQDDGDRDPTHYSIPGRSEFQFLYIPWDSQKLIGGYLGGLSGDIEHGVGAFDFEKLPEEGRYLLTIPGKTGDDGVLLLQNAGLHPELGDIADDSVLSYEYVGNHQFIVESRHPEGDGVGSDTFPTRDTDFYFVWVDFKEPLQPPAPCARPVIAEGATGPGPCPTFSVSAANWVAANDPAGFSGNISADLAGNGPIPWSMPRYNRGDLAVRISPFDPAAARTQSLELPPGQYSFDTETDPSAAAWGLSPERGITLATARRNGPIDWGDANGPFYPTIAHSGGATGRSYDLVSGTFGNFRLGDLDINTGAAGGNEPGGSPEATFDFATAWFPYAQGWIGGSFDNPTSEGRAVFRSAGAHSPGLLPGILTWFQPGGGAFGGAGKLTLPGVNSTQDGMLFTISSHGNSDVNITATGVLSDGSGWIYTSREDSEPDPTIVANVNNQSPFDFIYVPYTSADLIGGHIEGATGNKINARGTFEVARTEAGSYELAIPRKSGGTGILVLQNASLLPGSAVLADNHFFSYEYDAARSVFVIQSRATDGSTIGCELGDADFYLMYIDFTTPVAPPSRTPTPAATPMPTLAFQVAGSDLILSWLGVGYTLQWNDNLSATGNWKTVPGGAVSPVTVAQSGGQRFFRLVTPY